MEFVALSVKHGQEISACSVCVFTLHIIRGLIAAGEITDRCLREKVVVIIDTETNIYAKKSGGSSSQCSDCDRSTIRC